MSAPTEAPAPVPAPVATPVHAEEKTLEKIKPTRFIAFGHYVLMVIALILAVIFLILSPLKNYANVDNSVAGLSFDVVIAIFFLIVALVSFIAAELKRITTQYLVTDNKIVRRDGILGKRTQMVPYTQFKSVNVNQSFLQRVLHIGTVKIDTGEDALSIDTVHDPNKVQELLSQRIGRLSYSDQDQQPRKKL